jgi:hypothetical protein
LVYRGAQSVTVMHSTPFLLALAFLVLVLLWVGLALVLALERWRAHRDHRADRARLARLQAAREEALTVEWWP